MEDLKKNFIVYSFYENKHKVIASFHEKDNAIKFIDKLDKTGDKKNIFYRIKEKK